jgi:Glycosyltransferase like family
VIAFGVAITEPEPYLLYTEPGIRVAAEPDSEIFRVAAVGTFGRSYNVLLEAAAKLSSLEALVLAHPHAEIVDKEFCSKVRRALADPDVAVVGCLGASEPRSIAWWEGSVSAGPVIHRYTEYGGGELPAFEWTRPEPAPREVDAVDGFLLILSPWAVRNVSFDEVLLYGHGFEVDYCLQVRSRGKKVMTAPLEVVQHRSLEVVKDLALWTESHIDLARKWNGRLAGGDGASASDGDGDAAWRARARRAEAEREAARALAYSRKLECNIRLELLERELEEVVSSRSWQLTKPLRLLNLWRARAAALRQRAAPETPAPPRTWRWRATVQIPGEPGDGRGPATGVHDHRGEAPGLHAILEDRSRADMLETAERHRGPTRADR